MAEKEEPDSGINNADRHGLSVEKCSGELQESQNMCVELKRRNEDLNTKNKDLNKTNKDLKKQNSQQEIEMQQMMEKYNRLQNQFENVSAENKIIDVYSKKLQKKREESEEMLMMQRDKLEYFTNWIKDLKEQNSLEYSELSNLTAENAFLSYENKYLREDYENVTVERNCLFYRVSEHAESLDNLIKKIDQLSRQLSAYKLVINQQTRKMKMFKTIWKENKKQIATLQDAFNRCKQEFRTEATCQNMAIVDAKEDNELYLFQIRDNLGKLKAERSQRQRELNYFHPDEEERKRELENSKLKNKLAKEQMDMIRKLEQRIASYEDLLNRCLQANEEPYYDVEIDREANGAVGQMDGMASSPDTTSPSIRKVGVLVNNDQDEDDQVEFDSKESFG